MFLWGTVTVQEGVVWVFHSLKISKPDAHEMRVLSSASARSIGLVRMREGGTTK